MDINHVVPHRERISSSFLSLFYGVHVFRLYLNVGKHEVVVLDPCFFPFQSCLLRALNCLINPLKKKNKYNPNNNKKDINPIHLNIKILSKFFALVFFNYDLPTGLMIIGNTQCNFSTVTPLPNVTHSLVPESCGELNCARPFHSLSLSLCWISCAGWQVLSLSNLRIHESWRKSCEINFPIKEFICT